LQYNKDIDRILLHFQHIFICNFWMVLRLCFSQNIGCNIKIVMSKEKK